MELNPIALLAGLAFTVGAPLLAFLVRSAVTGRHYLKARWPVVAVYYVLVGGHEAAGRFGIPVAAPLMLLIMAGPIVGLILLVGPGRRATEERRRFEVEVGEKDSGR